MFDAITALCALQQESSTLKKQEMLRRYKDNEHFRLTPCLLTRFRSRR